MTIPTVGRLVLTLVLAFTIAGCGDDDGSGDGAGTGGGGGGSADDASGATVLEITVGDTTAGSWTLAEIEAEFEFATLTIDDDEQGGPLLIDVLEAAGIEEWDTAEVLGMGEGRSFEVGLEISKSDVDDQWVLDVSKKGTLKLATDDLPREQWVRDVAEIRFP